MKAEVPILQAIHRSSATADWRPWYNEEHGAAIRCIGINSNTKGYKITTYAGGWGYDGYNIQVQAEGGIGSKTGPQRVETGRDHRGLMRLSFGEPQVAESGLINVPATASQPPQLEKLLLPGDEGFDFFVELHKQVQDLEPVITSAVGLVQPVTTPSHLVYEHRGLQAGHFDYARNIGRVTGSTLVKVEDSSRKIVTVDLDATQEYPFEPRNPMGSIKINEDTVYRSGNATIEDIGGEYFRVLDFYTLIAFSGVQNAVEMLYKAKVEKS